MLRIKQRDTLGIAVLLERETGVQQLLSGVDPLRGFAGAASLMAFNGKHQEEGEPSSIVLINLVPVAVARPRRTGNVVIATFILECPGVEFLCELLNRHRVSKMCPKLCPKLGLSEINEQKPTGYVYGLPDEGIVRPRRKTGVLHRASINATRECGCEKPQKHYLGGGLS